MTSRLSSGRFSGLVLLGAVAFPGQGALGQQTTELVSVSSQGNFGIGFSETPSISADGRYVAFESTAGNLVPAFSPEADGIPGPKLSKAEQFTIRLPLRYSPPTSPVMTNPPPAIPSPCPVPSDV